MVGAIFLAMLEFTFSDLAGSPLWVSVQQPTAECGGGCCFDRAVADFRANHTPGFVPGDPGVIITTRGR